MTTQKTFKHRVRDRMAKTGESYTAARRQLIAKGDVPETAPAYEPLWSDEAVIGATGYAGQELVRILARHPGASLTLATGSRATGFPSRPERAACGRAAPVRCAPGSPP